jgi:hypothetical protein
VYQQTESQRHVKRFAEGQAIREPRRQHSAVSKNKKLPADGFCRKAPSLSAKCSNAELGEAPARDAVRLRSLEAIRRFSGSA